MVLPLQLLLLLHLAFLPLSIALTSDGHVLLKAKSTLDDPTGSLNNWNPLDPTPCNWTGVRCSPPPSSAVASLDLSDLNLSGPFPSPLCLLPHLRRLLLSDNNINSTLPSSSSLACPSLTHLDLSYNLLVGPIPTSLPTILPSLLHLDLTGNNLSGPIPSSLSLFPRLQNLSLVNNLLVGPIPPSLGNLTTLRQLNLSYNPFSPSSIPSSLGNLSSLQTLWLARCNLIGRIPPTLGNLRQLRNLDLSSNNLSGDIPSSLSALRSTFQIELYGNSLSGTIPDDFSNLTSLRNFDASMNRLSGKIPPALLRLPLLESLNLYQNHLEGPIPAGATSILSELRLFDNRLSGPIPGDLGSSSPLLVVDLSQNRLSGRIPSSICRYGKLEELMLIDNALSGGVPGEFGSCRSLRRLRLSSNHLSGEVPPTLWGLPRLYLLDLARNALSGVIAPQIARGTNLSSILISGNAFSGGIPAEIGALTRLYEFSAANNQISGDLPQQLRSLPRLGKLDLHNNSLSGDLLGDVDMWTGLTDLNLAGNRFTGQIPAALGGLPVLNYLDLSNNHLTGEVPAELQNLTLSYLNLSNNDLVGPIPPLFASGSFAGSFLGNPRLCLVGSPCPRGSSTRAAGDGRRHLWSVRWFVVALVALALVAAVSWFALRYRRLMERREMESSRWTLTSFHKLAFREYEILDCLDEDNVIGTGASGKVYRAVLAGGEIVAVKKLWGSKKEEEGTEVDEDKGFVAEVETLGRIRHKNIVKLWCCCVHKDCKLLVYEYMPNGSLGDLLHSAKSGLLTWHLRHKVAVDAAEGLSYLHHDCVPPIVHRDVKSNNILLDADFGARIADFGVAKVVDQSSSSAAVRAKPVSMSVVAGSYGYIAPEYAYTLRVNEKSDIYSFGVVLMELVTGRPSVDPEFGEKDLVKWVCATLEHKGVDHVLDPSLDRCHKSEMCEVLEVALQCTSSIPINRPSMRRVVKMLLDIGARREEGVKIGEREEDKLSSYYYGDNSSDQGSVV